MSFNELIILLVIALVLFGPEDLPDVARAIGKVVFEVKKIAGDMTKEFQEAVNTPTNVLKKTLDDTINPTPKKSSKEAKKETTEESSTVAMVDSDVADSNSVDSEEDKQATPNDEEELLTYDEDPLAELPQDMVSYEK